MGEDGGMDASGSSRKKSSSSGYSGWVRCEGGCCCGDDSRVEVSPPIRMIIEGKSPKRKGYERWVVD